MNNLVSIYEIKKVKYDFIINTYLIFITFLNVFVALDRTFAFASGINIGTNVESYARGLTLADLVFGSSPNEGFVFQSFIFLLFIFLILLLILNIIYDSNIKRI